MRLAPYAFLVLSLTLAACGGGSNGTTALSSGGNGSGGNGSGGTPSTPVATNTVNAGSDNTFNPSSIAVAVGTTVTWNFGSVTHNVTFGSSSAPANIPNTSAASVSRTFSTAGTFAYSCTLHPGMSGTVTVQ